MLRNKTVSEFKLELFFVFRVRDVTWMSALLVHLAHTVQTGQGVVEGWFWALSMLSNKIRY